MNNNQLKIAVISALRQDPDLKGLGYLRACNDGEVHRFLRWLDESGLALHLLATVKDSGGAGRLPVFVLRELERRLESNRNRAQAMLAEQKKLSESFTDRGIPHAFLKGFSLVPDFCPAIEFRHQTDIDILMPYEFIDSARSAMRECGYPIETSFLRGEFQFSEPRRRPASVKEDIYTPDFRHEVELHTTIWDELGHVVLTVPMDCLLRLRPREMYGVRFASLSLDDTFIVQTLHGFRHFLGSWLRVAWLFEIHSFFVRYSENDAIWLAIKTRAGDEPALRNAFGLMLQLTDRLFMSPIPTVMRDWCIEPLPDPLKQWVLKFGMRWVLSGLSGSKLSLFAHKEFIRNARVRRSYLWRRIVPVQGRPAIGRTETNNLKNSIGIWLAQSMFVAKRAFFHATSLGSLAIDAVSWAHTQHAIRRQRVVGV